MDLSDNRLDESLKNRAILNVWNSLNISDANKRFVGHVFLELIHTYKLSEIEAIRHIQASVFPELLNEFPHFVSHYDSRYWAKAIYKELEENELLS